MTVLLTTRRNIRYNFLISDTHLKVYLHYLIDMPFNVASKIVTELDELGNFAYQHT